MKGPVKVKGILIALCAMPVVAVLLFAFSSGAISTSKKDYGTVPEFKLVDQNGAPVGRSDLVGKVWIADFIFTSCEGVCPLLSEKVAKIVEEFGKDPHFRAVSFSVDPETDSPKVLKEYASRFPTSSEYWLFLTGERPELKELLEGGFKVGMGGMEGANTGVITHSEKVVVVDRQAKIRGYYDIGDDPKQFVELRRSIHKQLGRRF